LAGASFDRLRMTPHLINRVAVLGTGLIGGSFALALRKYAADLHVTGWDRPEVARAAQASTAFAEVSSDALAPALRDADLIFMALPIGVTIDLLPDIARLAPRNALVTDACSTKLRIVETAAELFSHPAGPLFLPGHPMAGRGSVWDRPRRCRVVPRRALRFDR
jgi:prephenate dehydrogenase